MTEEREIKDGFTAKADWKRFFNYKWIVKNIPFFLFLSGLAVLYIYNGHHSDKLVRKIANTEKNIKAIKGKLSNDKETNLFTVVVTRPAIGDVKMVTLQTK